MVGNEKMTGHALVPINGTSSSATGLVGRCTSPFPDAAPGAVPLLAACLDFPVRFRSFALLTVASVMRVVTGPDSGG